MANGICLASTELTYISTSKTCARRLFPVKLFCHIPLSWAGAAQKDLSGALKRTDFHEVRAHGGMPASPKFYLNG